MMHLSHFHQVVTLPYFLLHHSFVILHTKTWENRFWLGQWYTQIHSPSNWRVHLRWVISLFCQWLC